MSIYNLNGYDFLALAFGVQVAAWLLALSVKHLTLASSKDNDKCSNFDAYELAYLNGGAKHMLLTVLTALESSGNITLDLTKKTATLSKNVDAKAHPLEKVVCNALWSKPTELHQVYYAVKESLIRSADNLERSGLVLSKDASRWLLTFNTLILGIPLAVLDIPKILIGISLAKPVAGLVFLVVVNAIFLLWFLKEARTTVRGDKMLKMWKRNQSALKANFKSFARNLQAKERALGYALFAAFSTHAAFSPCSSASSSCGGSDSGWNFGGGGDGGGSCGGGDGGSCGGGCGGCGGCGS